MWSFPLTLKCASSGICRVIPSSRHAWMLKDGEKGPSECERASFTILKKSDVISPAKWRRMIWDFMMDHRGWDEMWVSMMKHLVAGTLKIINHGAWSMKCRASRVMKIFNFHSHTHMGSERHSVKIPLNPRIMNMLACLLVVPWRSS